MGAIVAQACHACTAVLHQFKEDPKVEEYLSDLDRMHKVVLEVSMCGLSRGYFNTVCLGGLIFAGIVRFRTLPLYRDSPNGVSVSISMEGGLVSCTIWHGAIKLAVWFARL